MSGHSKWSTIKRAKGITDAKRAGAFTKLANAIAIAVREGGGGDVNFNFKLRLAVEKARGANMPKENIARAIDKGLGKGDGNVLETATYEGFGPEGVAVIVETITDNTTRTGAELRSLFNKMGGSLGSPGSVGYMFGRVGQIVVSGSKFDEVFDNAIEAGAVEIEDLDGEVIVYTKVEDLHKAKENLVRQGVKISQAEIVYRPNKGTLVVVGEEKKAVVNDFLGLLDDFPDTQSVYANINDFI